MSLVALTLVALSAGETVFWVLALGVLAVVVFGMIALMVAMLRIVRSVSGSLAQLREVVAEQAAREQAAEEPATGADPEGPEGPSPDNSMPRSGNGTARERDGSPEV